LPGAIRAAEEAGGGTPLIQLKWLERVAKAYDAIADREVRPRSSTCHCLANRVEARLGNQWR
jgi:hypothetical protein